jgi:hypothetical protein
LKIAVQLNKPPTEDITDVDRIYIGERFCVERYLKWLEEFAAYARRCRLPVWLATPEAVTEGVLDKTAAATLGVAGCFEGVLVADPGLGMLLKSKCRLGLKWPALNRESAKRIAGLLGATHLRLYLPTLETIEALAGSLEIEITVHGKLPLASTPRCPVAGYRHCDDCETERTISGGLKPLLLRGNAVYASEPVSGFGLADKFRQLGVAWGVIEALHLDAGEIARLAAIYRGTIPPPDNSCSGMFINAVDSSFFSSGKWMDSIDVSNSRPNPRKDRQ